MSGYAAVVQRDDSACGCDDVERLLPALRARGPHGEEITLVGRVGIASTRLDTGDPLEWPTVARVGERLVAAGQVRLDDRAALVDALRAAGASIAEGHPDIALFAHAWLAWGRGALERLAGEFSVTLVDLQSRRITLIRDPLGARMLFYHVRGDVLVASNTLGAVLAARDIPRDLDPHAIADFVATGMNERVDATSFAAVRRVPPAHTATIDAGGSPRVERYWSLPEPTVAHGVRRHDAVQGFRDVLSASVRDRLRTPRATVFVSGGVDSSLLLGIATQAIGGNAICARTTHLPRTSPSEDAGKAIRFARSLGVHHELFDADDFGYEPGTATESQLTPEPYDEPSLRVLHHELRAASAWSPVALWGEDPDTLLAPPNVAEQLRGQSPLAFTWRVLRYILREGARPHLGARQLLRRRTRARIMADDHATGDMAERWLRPEFARARRERTSEREVIPHRTRGEVATRLASPLWQSFLESMDAGTHGIPIDVRLPFMDQRVIRHAMSLPAIPWLQRKHVLREAARGIVPDDIRLAKKRGLVGFTERRATEWLAAKPRPFTPSAQLREYVAVESLRPISAHTPAAELLLHLRLRILDRWLRAQGGEASTQGE